MNKLELIDISKGYGDVAALKEISLTVKEGEFVTLLGPSGSGKSTLLKIVAGMVSSTSGQILIDGRDNTGLDARKRDLGMVFQNYALMPHMTVAENVAFPLKVRRESAASIHAKVKDALSKVRLSHLAERMPAALSGGQQQRVAIARAIVYKPSLVLMDEPLGALDKKLREQLQVEIMALHRDMGITVLYVTHDQAEAMSMSDRVVLMNNGRIEQIDAPRNLYARPQSRFTADFLGESNFFPDAPCSGDNGELASGAPHDGQPVILARPEHIRFARQPYSTIGFHVSARAVSATYFGSVTHYLFQRTDAAACGQDDYVKAVRLNNGADDDFTAGEDYALFWQPEHSVRLTR